MSPGNPRVAVVYNSPVLKGDDPDAASEADVVNVAYAVLDALRKQGFVPALIAASPPLEKFLSTLADAKADLVFNLAEGYDGDSAGATYLTALFELLGLPYTGSPVEALAACVSKSRAKALLRGSGLPTANSSLILRHDPIPEVDFANPMLVKPDAEDGSLGIDEGSVVLDRSALIERVQLLRSRYGGSVLVETYLPGDEFNLGVVALPEPCALPVSQLIFAPEMGRWPILTYEGKWETGSVADLSSRVVCPAPIDVDLAKRLSALAVSAFRATGCRDYGRIDMRLDGEGDPMILEVNPNPDIGPGAGLSRAAGVSGMSYEQLIGSIAREALRRGP